VYGVPLNVKDGIVMAVENSSSNVADHRTVPPVIGVYVPAVCVKPYPEAWANISCERSNTIRRKKEKLNLKILLNINPPIEKNF
jgi:hypothetical protein